MSSGGLTGRSGALHFIDEKPPEHLVGEPVPEQAESLGPIVTGRDAALDVRLSRPVASTLRDGDPVEGSVDLSIATTIESEFPVIPGPNRDRRRPVPASECGPGAKATHASCLAHNLGG